jgi:prepilin-type N-terminal cleavage/methylation domain-containing protein
MRGFTLIEVMIALALSGMVLLGGSMLLVQTTDTRDRIARQALEGDETYNGARLLRALVRNAQATTDTTERFTGDARATGFVTACQTPGGWLERCRVQLLIDQRRDSSVVIGELRAGEAIALLRLAGAWSFVYLDRAREERRWLTSWGTSIALPAAVGLVSAGDTLVWPIGAAQR